MEAYQIAYKDFVDTHRANVKFAAEWIKNNLPEYAQYIDDDVIENHDISKYGEEEFEPYAKYFNIDKEAYKTVFDVAFLHHVKNNPHHWNHWVLVEGTESVRVFQMPTKYIMEMICDWMSFSLMHEDSAIDVNGLGRWYEENRYKIFLHSETRKFVDELIEKILAVK